jgi:hypothetical protein
MPPIDWTKTIAIWERIQKTKEKDASEHELMFTSLSEAEKLMKDAQTLKARKMYLQSSPAVQFMRKNNLEASQKEAHHAGVIVKAFKAKSIDPK